jgi:WD40 repeat protein
LNTENTPSVNPYSVSGSREGQVTVTDTISGETIHTFEIDSGVVVRETFILEGGKTVAASQKDHAVFWDLTTGEEIRRFLQIIYGFYRNKIKFFT